MVVCRYFQQGHCAKGDTCSFEHSYNAITTIPTAATVRVKKQTPCVFFHRGTCRYGAICKNAHEPNASPAPAPAPTRAAPVDSRSDTPCTFFLRNACSKGANCPFSHASTFPSSSANFTKTSTAGGNTEPQQSQADRTLNLHGSEMPLSANSDLYSRAIGGAMVTFGNGMIVSKVLLPSNFSTLALTNIPADTTPEDFRERLKLWTQSEAIDVVSVKLDPQTMKKSAQIKIADGGRASRNIVGTDHKSRLDGTDIDIHVVQLGQSESGTNRLLLSGVTCTWHDPSTTAHLRYGSANFAAQALSNLKKDSRTLRGRRPTVEHAHVSRWLNVGSLDVRTSVDDLTQYFNRFPTPLEIGLGKKTHNMSSVDIEQRVQASLEKCGQVLERSITHQRGSAKVKAYVKFSTEHEAIQAVKQLDGSMIGVGSNDKLHVQHVISVKLPVSQRVLVAIGPLLNNLIETARSTHYVSIKAYENPLKSYTQIRVSGSDKTTVARVKMQVEELLAGNVATDGTLPLTLPFFFQVSSSTFLDHVMNLYGVLVVRDPRKMVLRLYGEAMHIKAAQEALQAKALEVESQAKEVILNQTTLAAAMRGGFQQIVTTLGKNKVNLDITSNPKRIFVTGSDKDVGLIREILDSRPSDLSEAVTSLKLDEENGSLCAVCWTPAEDPIKTTCGHVYCSSCIEAQATSTSDFPLCCLGDCGRCNTPLTLEELKRTLAGGSYEALHETSLTKHIRTHPDEFQYCPTPDCDRFYRTSTTEFAIAFNCDRCLVSICTACHNVAHDGGTCHEAKAARDGADAFAEWKKKNDARDCPKCGTPIQKSVGCNHMECSSCHTHICWKCMKTFKLGSEVYGHMSKEHGDWGVGELPPEFL